MTYYQMFGYFIATPLVGWVIWNILKKFNEDRRRET